MVTREEVLERVKLNMDFSLLSIPSYVGDERRNKIKERNNEIMKYLEDNLK